MRDLLPYAAQCKRELDRLRIRYAADITFAVNGGWACAKRRETATALR